MPAEGYPQGQRQQKLAQLQSEGRYYPSYQGIGQPIARSLICQSTPMEAILQLHLMSPKMAITDAVQAKVVKDTKSTSTTSTSTTSTTTTTFIL